MDNGLCTTGDIRLLQREKEKATITAAVYENDDDGSAWGPLLTMSKSPKLQNGLYTDNNNKDEMYTTKHQSLNKIQRVHYNIQILYCTFVTTSFSLSLLRL